jgi:chromatin remodeling complex protein RSC6
VVGADAMARHEVVKKIWAIIKEKNLYVSSFLFIFIRMCQSRHEAQSVDLSHNTLMVNQFYHSPL